MAYFPEVSEHFVGRVATLAEASQALAPESAKTAVLFHGMAGGGKTACALELAFHYEKLDRFTDFVWFQAPEQGSEISGAMLAFALNWETQVRGTHDQPRLPFSHLLANPAEFQNWLPRLKQFLRHNSVLIVLDNLESLQLSDGRFRDDLWTNLLTALLDHHGLSRTILTSRVEPVAADRTKLLTRPIHALPLNEAALLARQLKNLGGLLRSENQRPLVVRTLKLVQGHPKLVEFAEALASDPAKLSTHPDRAEQAETAGALPLKKFFESGESALGVEQFLEVLGAWTESISQAVSQNARTLFYFLCCLEEPDREEGVVKVVWPELWKQHHPDNGPPAFEPLLKELTSSALINEIAGKKNYAIHPGVAEAGRSHAGSGFRATVDEQAGEFWLATRHFALGEEKGAMVVRAGLSGAPYMMRRQRLDAASTLLEHVASRDRAPSTLVAILPLLRRIAEATAGSPRGLTDAGVLAKVLSLAGRVEEAEGLMRETIRTAVQLEEFYTASATAGDLINVLHQTGRSQDALALMDQKKEYTRRADVGPWSQLADEGQLLQILGSLGKYEEVLSDVEKLRKTMQNLVATPPIEKREAAAAWNVQEGTLNVGLAAALALGRWETALSLNREILEISEGRGASPLEIARTRFNDYGPLLRLERLSEAWQLLDGCRSTFERAGSTPELGERFQRAGRSRGPTGQRRSVRSPRANRATLQVHH